MLKEGDIIEIVEGDEVYALVPEHFLYTNRRGNFALAKGKIKVGGDFNYLVGRYVVYKTAFEGGGTGHGPGDVYPDGHHVYCEKMDDSKARVDFYQSGSFTAMLPNKEAVGRGTIKWVEE